MGSSWCIYWNCIAQISQLCYIAQILWNLDKNPVACFVMLVVAILNNGAYKSVVQRYTNFWYTQLSNSFQKCRPWYNCKRILHICIYMWSHVIFPLVSTYFINLRTICLLRYSTTFPKILHSGSKILLHIPTFNTWHDNLSSIQFFWPTLTYWWDCLGS